MGPLPPQPYGIQLMNKERQEVATGHQYRDNVMNLKHLDKQYGILSPQTVNLEIESTQHQVLSNSGGMKRQKSEKRGQSYAQERRPYY